MVGFCLLAAYTVFCDEDFGPGPSSFQMDVLHHEFSESMFCWYITSPFRGGEMGNRVSSTDVLKPLKPCVLALDRINDSQRHVGLFKGNPFRLKFKILDINSLTWDWPLQQFYLLVGLFGNFVFFFFFFVIMKHRANIRIRKIRSRSNYFSRVASLCRLASIEILKANLRHTGILSSLNSILILFSLKK